MELDTHMSISEFSSFTGIKRANLIFYDRIGLLKPAYRGENNYRFYTRKQLELGFMIYALRDIGVSIEEIKAYASTRSPEAMLELFAMHQKQIQKEIDKLKHVKEIMSLYGNQVLEATHVDLTQFHVIEQCAQSIFLGDLLKEECSSNDNMLSFYNKAIAQGVGLSYPFGAIIDQDSLRMNQEINAKQLYLKVPHATYAKKPAGTYLVGYVQGDYGSNDHLYSEMIAYCDAHHYTICGDAYEEYPFNEITTLNPDEYLIKVEIMIKR